MTKAENNLSVLNKETKMYLPNEIFEDLVGCKKLKMKKTSSPYIAFAYSYIYLSYWLYWTCNYYADHKITQKVVKGILGYSESNKTMDFIMKEGGVTDELGYTRKTRDYPVTYSYENDFVEFQTISELDIELPTNYPKNGNFIVNEPIKGFHRTKLSENERLLDGTFYEVENTHCIPFEVFMYCMSEKEVGTIGFYLYAFLKHKNDLYKEGAQYSRERLEYETGIKGSSLDKYLEILQKHNMLDADVQDIQLGSPVHLRQANTYEAKGHSWFYDTGRYVRKRKVTAYKEKKRLSELPF